VNVSFGKKTFGLPIVTEQACEDSPADNYADQCWDVESRAVLGADKSRESEARDLPLLIE